MQVLKMPRTSLDPAHRKSRVGPRSSLPHRQSQRRPHGHVTATYRGCHRRHNEAFELTRSSTMRHFCLVWLSGESVPAPCTARSSGATGRSSSRLERLSVTILHGRPPPHLQAVPTSLTSIPYQRFHHQAYNLQGELAFRQATCTLPSYPLASLISLAVRPLMIPHGGAPCRCP